MSEKKNNQNTDIPNVDSKSSKKLKFQNQPQNSGSVESINSVQSFSEKEEETGNSETSQHSFLNKFAPLPLEDAAKIYSFNPCFSKSPSIPQIELTDYDPNKALASDKSSQQLFETGKISPIDPDVKLISSAYLRKLEGVKDAIRHGANVNTLRDKQTVLLISSEIGEHRLVAYLLTVPNINPDIPNVFGETPLHVAVRNAFGRIIKLLLSHNADVNKVDNMGRTPLQIALFQKRPRLAKLLLAYGADYEKEDCFGERPMYTSAVKRPDLRCLLVLLKVGATPEYVNISGTSLLSRTILNCTKFKIIRLLIRFGASVNSQDYYSSKTPLHFAALTNDVKIANYLLAFGADANKTTVYDFTPFDEAVFHKNIEVAEVLLKHTKNPRLRAQYLKIK